MSDLKLTTARARLASLKATVDRGAVGSASREWGGAHVVVSSKPLGSGYREIVTPHSLEVSWLIEQLRDTFSKLINSRSKYEFYGRLELAANRSIAVGQREVVDLGRVMIEVSEIMLDEMSRKEFKVLSIAVGPEIATDRLE